MSYTPTTWTTGDTITASAMNKIEQGIANAGGGGSDYDFVVRKTGNTAVLEKGTFTDVYNKLTNSEPVFGLFVKCTDEDSSLCVPLNWTYYYASLGNINGYAMFYEGTMRRVHVEIADDNSVTAQESNLS